MTKHPTNALAAMIIELDRSRRRFSHAGVMGEDGRVVSAYPHYSLTDFFDLGGLYHDRLEHFFAEGQDVHRLVLPGGTTSDRAAREVSRYPESREGRFGFAKVVIVAAALHALLPENPLTPAGQYEVVKRAIEAGHAWESDDDFYCAEFVAHVYDRPFTLKQLRPPPRPATIVFPERLTGAAITVGSAWLSLFASTSQRRTLPALQTAVWKHDPDFFLEGVQVVSGAEPHAHEQIDRRREASKLDDAEIVPAALVTPRMLEEWGTQTRIVAGSPSLAP